MASTSHNRGKKAQGSGVGNWTIIPDNLMVRNEQGHIPSSERREHTRHTSLPFPPLTTVTSEADGVRRTVSSYLGCLFFDTQTPLEENKTALF